MWMVYQLCNFINRHNVVNSPNENKVACEDLMITVTEVHILAAAMEILGLGPVPLFSRGML